MRQAPAYCIHKTRNLAFVRLGGRMLYLGRAHSPESHERYHTTLAAHFAGKPLDAAAKPRRRASAFTVGELAEQWYLGERERRGPQHPPPTRRATSARNSPSSVLPPP